MTTFYFVRHGHMDTSMAGKKFYKDFSYNMMTLSEKGIGQIKETAKDISRFSSGTENPNMSANNRQ